MVYAFSTPTPCVFIQPSFLFSLLSSPLFPSPPVSLLPFASPLFSSALIFSCYRVVGETKIFHLLVHSPKQEQLPRTPSWFHIWISGGQELGTSYAALAGILAGRWI